MVFQEARALDPLSVPRCGKSVPTSQLWGLYGLGAPYRSALRCRLGLGDSVTQGSSPGRGCDGEDQVTSAGVEGGVHQEHREREATAR